MTKEKYTLPDGVESYILHADEGKVLQRISDEFISGKSVALGYTYYINGVKLDKPQLELPEDYQEIDENVENQENSSKIE